MSGLLISAASQELWASCAGFGVRSIHICMSGTMPVMIDNISLRSKQGVGHRVRYYNTLTENNIFGVLGITPNSLSFLLELLP